MANRALLSSITPGRRREPLDKHKVTRYRHALRRGDMFPPIAVIKYRPGCYSVFDGYHRFHAHRLEGRKTIAVTIIVG